MTKKLSRRLFTDEDILSDLNSIADYVIGNESPDEVSFTEHGTLPEAISYAMMNPGTASAVNDALSKMKELRSRVEKLEGKLKIMKNWIDIRKQPKQYS